MTCILAIVVHCCIELKRIITIAHKYDVIPVDKSVPYKENENETFMDQLKDISKLNPNKHESHQHSLNHSFPLSKPSLLPPLLQSKRNPVHQHEAVNPLLENVSEEKAHIIGSNSNINSNSTDHDEKNNVNEVVKIEINPNSTMAAEIHSVLHFQNESKIVIHLHKQRNCSQPKLVGRLSGPALTKIIWEEQDYHFWQQNNTDVVSNLNVGDTNHGDSDDFNYDVLIGHYNAPVPGQYFLEIIVVLCAELQMETNFQPFCVEDPSRHQLTLNGAFIHAQVTATSTALKIDISNSSIIGHWYNTNETQIPLYTRYQPPNCRGQSSALYRCKEIDLSGFDRYKFRFSSQMNIDLKSILKGKEGKICFEGASHAGQLFNHTNITLSTLDASIQRNIQVSPITKAGQYTKFANEFNSPDTIKRIIDKKCTKVIIGTGQWDAGWPKHHPTLFSDYEKILNSSIPTMLKRFHDANIDVYYRSMQ